MRIVRKMWKELEESKYHYECTIGRKTQSERYDRRSEFVDAIQAMSDNCPSSQSSPLAGYTPSHGSI